MTFDPDTLRPMVIDMDGNVTAIAKKMKVDSEDLRNFVMNTPVLRRAMDEVIARGVDQSIRVLFDGLDDEHLSNRLTASKVFLKSRAAQRRGFANADLELRAPGRGGSLTLTWLPPEDKPSATGLVPVGKPDPPMIEGKVEE